jgi:hypothetical protein
LADLVKRRLAPHVDEPTELGGEPLMASLLRGNWAYFPSLCWRREQIASIGFDPSYDMVMDLALLMQVLRDGGSLVVDPQVTFRYRRHDASYSALRALDGDRFADERGFFAREATTLRAAGLTRAERSARLHLTSRLHALSWWPQQSGPGDGTRSGHSSATRSAAPPAKRRSPFGLPRQTFGQTSNQSPIGTPGLA